MCSSLRTIVQLTSVIVSLSVVAGRPAGDDGCGVRGDVQTRIVGGDSSQPGKWPWMAALYRGPQTQYCAGALISDRHILTAAHCVASSHPSKLHVRLGEFDIPSRQPNHTIQLLAIQDAVNKKSDHYFGVEKITIHQQYDPRSHLHDIAILRLDRKVRFSPLVQRVCLPSPSLPSLENRVAFVAGWGTTAFLGPASPSLREVQVPIWDNGSCLKAIGKNVFDTTLCAGGKEKSADACQGDSGGPLMMPMADDRWAAVGVVSWGIRCGEPSKPGLYTRISLYVDWILSAVQRT